MKRLLIEIESLLILSIMILPALISLTNAQSGQVTLNPTDDSYTDKIYHLHNYGGDSGFLVSNVPSLQYGWLKFNITTVHDNATGISAYLKLYCNNPPRIEPEFASTAPRVSACHCSSNTWNEETITWDNQPSFSSTPLDTQSIYYNDEYHKDDNYWSWNVTGAVAQSMNAGSNLITIVFTISSNYGSLAFASKETIMGGRLPELTVQWSEEIPEFPHFLLLSIFMILTFAAIVLYKNKLQPKRT